MFKGKIYKNKLPETSFTLTKPYLQEEGRSLGRVLSQPNMQTINTTKYQVENGETFGNCNASLSNFQNSAMSATAIDHLLEMERKMRDRVIQVEKRYEIMVNQL